MKRNVKTTLRPLLTPKTLILLVAMCNCVAVWMASDPPGLCFICPWYQHWSFTNEPTRLLVSACLLRLGKAWGYSAAIALCGFILLGSVPNYAYTYAGGRFLESLKEV
jgi:hypothetical protein